MIKASERNDFLLAACSLPLYITASGFYGLKILLLLCSSVLCGFFVEFISGKILKVKIKQFGYYIWILFPLLLPPAFPIWMAVVSLAFGLIVTRVFFGGHGYEIISPLAVSWSFAFLSFQTVYSFSWVFPFNNILAGFSRWNAAVPSIDSPVELFSNRLDSFLYAILNGGFPQTIGNSIPLLTIALGLILLIFRVIDYRIVAAFIFTYFTIYLILYFIGLNSILHLSSIFIGNFCFTLLFVLADKRIASRTNEGKWISGILAGIAAIMIIHFSSFPQGIVFSVLIMNVFSAIIDEAVLQLKYGG